MRARLGRIADYFGFVRTWNIVFVRYDGKREVVFDRYLNESWARAEAVRITKEVDDASEAIGLDPMGVYVVERGTRW